MTLAQRAQDPALLLEAHHELWANLSSLGELTSARTHLEQGFALYDPQKHKHHAFLYGGHDPGVCCAYHAAEVLVAAWLSRPGSAEKPRLIGPGSRAISPFHPSLTPCPSPLGSISIRGERQAVQARVEEGMTLATEQGFSSRLAQANFLQGWLLVEDGHWEAGITHMV